MLKESLRVSSAEAIPAKQKARARLQSPRPEIYDMTLVLNRHGDASAPSLKPETGRAENPKRPRPRCISTRSELHVQLCCSEEPGSRVSRHSPDSPAVGILWKEHGDNIAPNRGIRIARTAEITSNNKPRSKGNPKTLNLQSKPPMKAVHPSPARLRTTGLVGHVVHHGDLAFCLGPSPAKTANP